MPNKIELWVRAYNEESFFVRHAYFLGANDPYKRLKTTLRAEIDEDISRPFPRPSSGRIVNELSGNAFDALRQKSQ